MKSRLLPFDTDRRCACGHRACAEIDGEALCAACVRRLEAGEAEREQPSGSWLDEIWGKWPGDESDEEIARLVEEIS